jgi:hypothetical protein
MRARDRTQDGEFVTGALVEGSATEIMSRYLLRAQASGGITMADMQGLMESETERSRVFLEAPPYFQTLLANYTCGMNFLLEGKLALLGQETEVDGGKNFLRAVADPPRSSEQILHPEKYWDRDRRDEPKRVTIPNPSRALGEGWTRAGAGILGELTLGSLVGAKTPDAAELASGQTVWTNAAASGWGGDRFELWTHGDAAVVLLVTVWDTAKDAEEFEAALPREREGFAFRRAGTTVGIVAGGSVDRRDALLTLLATP